MKKTKLLFLLLFLYFNSKAATITSVPGGGSWGDTLTWVGHVVPALSDNVVIAGPVTFGQNLSMVDLEINSNGTLTNTNSAYRTIFVNGNLTNSSILDDNIHFNVEGSVANSGTIACNMNVAGDVDNNGIWSAPLILNGDILQTISGNFNSSIISENTFNQLSIGSPMELKGTFNLAGDTLDIGQNTVTFREGGKLIEGHYKNINLLHGIEMTGYNDGYFYPPQGGALTITGRVEMWSDADVLGDLVVADTMIINTNSSTNIYDFNIEGDLQNSGHILSGVGSKSYFLEVGGKLTNEGTIHLIGKKLKFLGDVDNNDYINVTEIVFDGDGIQEIEGEFSDPMKNEKEGGQIRLSEMLILKHIFYMFGDTLDVSEYQIEQEGLGRFTGGHYKNISELHGIAMTSQNDGYFYPPQGGVLTLTGEVKMWSDVDVLGDLVVADTMIINTTSTSNGVFDFNIEGGVLNMGHIISGSGSKSYFLEVSGMLTNNGTINLSGKRIKLLGDIDNNDYINVTEIVFEGDGLQMIEGEFSDPLKNEKEGGQIRLSEILILKHIFYMFGDTLDVSEYQVEQEGPGRFTGGHYKNISELYGINMTSQNDGYFYPPQGGVLTLTGEVKMWSDVNVLGDLVVIDTMIINTTSISNGVFDFNIEGDLLNMGQILSGSGSKSYFLEVGGKLTNEGAIHLIGKRIKLLGDADNNDYINVTEIVFEGDGLQMIEGEFSDPLKNEKEGGQIRLSGILILRNIFYMFGDTLDVSEYQVEQEGPGRFTGGHYKNISELYGINMTSQNDGYFYPPPGDELTITGEVCMWKDVEIIGDLVIEDTMSIVSTGSAGDNLFNVLGNLLNNGHIFHLIGDSPYNIEVLGNLTNNGTIILPNNLFLEGNVDNNNHINVTSIELQGSNLQYLEGTFNDPIYSYKTSTQIALSGPLDIGKVFNFDGDTLDMAEYKLTLRDEGRFLYGHYMNAKTIEGIGTLYYSNGHFYPPSGDELKLQGEVCMWKDVEILGNLHIQDTLSLVSTSSGGDNRFNIRGDLNNQGTMMHLEGNYAYDVEVEGNLINGDLGLIDFNEPLIVRGDLENSSVILVESVEIKGEGSTQNVCLLNSASINSEVNFWPDNLPEESLFWIKDDNDTIGYNFVHSFPSLMLVDGGTYHAIKNGAVSRNIIVKGGALPIELIEFEATYLGDKRILLSWKTASENNNDYYTIQRSDDGIRWEDIKNIPSIGNSVEIQNYSTEDHINRGGTFYYKLIQTDFDGSRETVDIVSLQVDLDEISIYPNPPIGILNVEYSDPIELSLCDLNGRVIKFSSMNKQHKINTSTLQSGIYMLYIRNITGDIINTDRIYIPK